MQADGFSLDDKRNPLPNAHATNNLPDVLDRWQRRDGTEHTRFRTEQSFCVPKAEIAANGYDLSINRYKEVVHEVVEYESPAKILADLKALEQEIMDGMAELEGMLK